MAPHIAAISAQVRARRRGGGGAGARVWRLLEGCGGVRSGGNAPSMSGGQTWREVELSKSVSVKGVYGGTQPHCLSTKEIYVKNKKVLLVKVRKTDHWLQKITQGKNCRRNCLARTHLLERIREQLVGQEAPARH